ncbi:hypothetical protein XELAEV_18002955mg [Xenopus laevis]|nr:hypothetical protein XELAEV_18002955mg [Xenopus laevis]
MEAALEQHLEDTMKNPSIVGVLCTDSEGLNLGCDLLYLWTVATANRFVLAQQKPSDYNPPDTLRRGLAKNDTVGSSYLINAMHTTYMRIHLVYNVHTLWWFIEVISDF